MKVHRPPRSNAYRRRIADCSIEPLEARIAPARLVALNSTGSALLPFDSTTPGTLQPIIIITGLNAGEALQGIDFRPDTGQLFGIGVSGTTGRIGNINVATGVFTQVGATFTVAGSDFGFDFNPTNDRIRLTSDTDINLLINPNDGVVTVQGTLNPGNPNVVGSAYSNNFGTATSTALFAIDSATDQLFTQVPATGTLSLVGALGVDTSGAAGFDIAGNGTAFASLFVGGSSRLFTINLNTGTATSVGQISPAAITVRGLAVQRFVWDGGGADSNWSTAANWVGDVAPVANDDLVFPSGAARLINVNDFAPGTDFNSLTFNGVNYDISGNAIDLARGIVTNVPLGGAADLGPIFRPAVTLLNAETFEANGSRGVSLRGAFNLNGHALTVTNTAPSTAPMIIDGDITGAGGITKNGDGTFFLTGNNSYAGVTAINAGFVNARSDNALGAIGAGNGTIVASGATLLIGFNHTIPEPLTLSGAGVGGAGALGNDVGNNSASGPITLAAATTIANNNNGTSLTVSGNIDNGGFALTASTTSQITLGGVISGAGGLTKTGAGTLTLNASNTFSGGTSLSTGTLLVNGSIDAVDVTGGLLGGTGSVGAITAASGTIAPGASPGSLNATGNVLLGLGSIFSVELNGLTAGTEYDRLNVTGSVTLAGDLNASVGFIPNDGDAFTIIANDGTDAVTGTFAGQPEGSRFNFGARLYRISYAGGDGNDVVLTAITPMVALSADGKRATYRDIDGDRVSITTDIGAFDQSDFLLVPVSGFTAGAQLVLINLGDDGDEFAQANITIVATPTAAGGNGFANIGYLNAVGVDLGKVKIAGDLGQIDCGDGDPVKRGLLALKAQSIGALGLSTQAAGGSLQSDIAGDLGALAIKGDLHSASVIANAAAGAQIGSVFVRGSLLASSLQANGAVGMVKILGNVDGSTIGSDDAGVGTVTVGGSLGNGSKIVAGTRIGSVTIAGSLTAVAKIAAGTRIGTVTVGGAIEGSASSHVIISAFGKANPPATGPDLAIKSISVRNRVEGLLVLAGYDAAGNELNADASIGAIAVGGDWSASTVLAGATTAFDQIQGPTVRDDPNISSSIARIVIKGQAFGTTVGSDDFAIVGEAIGKARIGAAKLPFTPGPRTVGDRFFVAPTGPGATGNPSDFAIFELGS